MGGLLSFAGGRAKDEVAPKAVAGARIELRNPKFDGEPIRRCTAAYERCRN